MPSKVQCKRCANLINGWCECVIDSPDMDLLRDCQYYRTLTNAIRIQHMEVEEIAELFTEMEYDGHYVLFCPVNLKKDDCVTSDCRECFLDWLKQEVADGKTDYDMR